MVIVGAGIIGLSCAWRLARRGHAVTVFDAREAASEASWAGAGMLAPGGEIDRDSAIADMALRSIAQYPDFVAELEQDSGATIDFQRNGAIELASTAAEAEALKQRAAWQSSIGIASEACEFSGRPARFYPGDAIVDPRDVTQALGIVCRRLGVTVRENEPVLNIAADGRSVRTPGGEYADDGVLIAAGAWSSTLYGGLPRTMPVRGHLIGYPAAPGTLGTILRHGHTYLLQRRSGLLIAGATTEHAGFDRGIDRAAAAGIHNRASALLPQLRSFPDYCAWNGFRPGIESDRPAIGRIPGTSVWTAFGHYRNGILLAPETARLIAESMA
ncbi:MAG TPA: FAD-dependent oxidoreductase [Bryobacteraceae bacterium]|nr:FAD-dependent oxidoreductase [Bryobacteraceae bacterium]